MCGGDLERWFGVEGIGGGPLDWNHWNMSLLFLIGNGGFHRCDNGIIKGIFFFGWKNLLFAL